MCGYGGYNHLAFTAPWKIGDVNYIDIFRSVNYFTLTFSKIINNAFIWYSNFLFNGNAYNMRNANGTYINGIKKHKSVYKRFK